MYNIYRRQDGRWEGRISKGKKTNGQYSYKSIYGNSKKDVETKITNYYRQSAEIETSITVEEAFIEWMKNNKYRIKESTYANYHMKYEKHIANEFGKLNLQDLSSEELTKFIERKKESGLSVRYISDILVLIKGLYKFASKVYGIHNPIAFFQLPKKKKTEINILNDSQQQLLQRYIQENESLTTMGIALSMTTGIRIGELCALKWADIDLKKRILTVKGTLQRIQCNTSNAKTKLILSEPKSESSQRQIPIPDCMMNFLSKFKGEDSDYILSGTNRYIEPRTMQYRFASILKNAKLPSVPFHTLRHMFASNCIKWGFDVKTLSELLGHNSVEITLNLYVHSSFERKRSYMKRVKFNFYQ